MRDAIESAQRAANESAQSEAHAMSDAKSEGMEVASGVQSESGAESASGVDMSEAAVTRRIRRVADLRDLCLRLGRARPLGPVE